MNAYKRVISVTLIFAVLLAATMPFLRQKETVALFVIVLVAEFVADVIATLYIARLVRADAAERRQSSWLFLMIFTTCAMTTVGLAPIAFLVVNSALGNPPLPDAWGSKITGVGLVLAGSVPIMKAALFRLIAADPRADLLRTDHD